MNAKTYAEMASNLEYIGEVSGKKYEWNTDDIMKPKDKDKTKGKGKAEMILKCRALNKTLILI